MQTVDLSEKGLDKSGQHPCQHMVAPPTLAWPQNNILPPISNQMDRGQTGISNRTETFRQLLDTNENQTEENNCIAYNEVEEIIFLPDEERFQVKQKEKDLKLEKVREEENDSEDGKTSSKIFKKRQVHRG
ncbi:hypothetical protein DPEC_G00301710 [Dallia pectoralis]|uniref:Uncharacterized protein n=1 Tax=Dallia pectoralis TaxID=75939 RepID=A0ACC2FGR1_DALPE|nr:hypothetical protein DPEC_G00301710 [Dallia pectoralis]